MDVVEGSGGGDQVCQKTADLAETEGHEVFMIRFEFPLFAWAAVTAR
ncbi:hypothetical protein ACWCHM_21645 [Micromonospora sp. SCSIO 07396]